MKACFNKYTLNFKQASATSRGVYLNREIWLLVLTSGEVTGIGECAPLPGLSLETPNDMSRLLQQVCDNIEYFITFPEELHRWPAIRFGLETALLDLQSGGRQVLFPSAFTRGEQGIRINGLIWMGSVQLMKEQIRCKIDSGFKCLKLKIGALDFETEFNLLKDIRKEFSPDDIAIRVDANGAYSYRTALENLKRLSDLRLHSIEQPIKQGQIEFQSLF